MLTRIKNVNGISQPAAERLLWKLVYPTGLGGNVSNLVNWSGRQREQSGEVEREEHPTDKIETKEGRFRGFACCSR